MKYIIVTISPLLLFAASLSAMDDGQRKRRQSGPVSIETMRQNVQELPGLLTTYCGLLVNYPRQFAGAEPLIREAWGVIDRMSDDIGVFNIADTSSYQALLTYQGLSAKRDRLLTIADSLREIRRSARANQGSSTASSTAVSDQSAVSASSTAENNQSNTTRQINCLICADDKDYSQFVTLSCSQHHRYCIECLTDMLNKAVHDISIPLQCPDLACRAGITEQDVRAITDDPALRDAFYERTYQEWVRTQPNAKNCPTPNCTFIFLNEEGIRQTIRCPQCHQIYCPSCLKNHSLRITCCEAEEMLRMPNDPERATEEWRQRNTKQCPQCHADIEKNGGCLHMTCKNCRHEFCWRCLHRWPCPTFMGDFFHLTCPDVRKPIQES